MGELNISSMSVGSAINVMGEMYVNMVLSKISFEDVPAVFMWGPPGIGKSAAVEQVAEIIEERTGKKVNITDIRLLMYSPTDLMGLPSADEHKEFQVWLKPKILDFDPSENVINILFLDELSSAPTSIQTIAYQMTLDRAVGENKFPANTIVIAAGNRSSDKAVSYKMPSPLANRMLHIEIAEDFNSWRNWAIANTDINPLVLGYLSFDVSKLYKFDKDNVAFPTPRSWMFVSNLLNLLNVTDDPRPYLSIISGLIGTATAIEFINWCNVVSVLPKAEDVLTGKTYKYPVKADALYAFLTSVTKYAITLEKGRNAGGLTASEIEYISAFGAGLPVDYAICFFLNLTVITGISKKLMKSQSFMEWANKHKKALSVGGFTI